MITIIQALITICLHFCVGRDGKSFIELILLLCMFSEAHGAGRAGMLLNARMLWVFFSKYSSGR